MCSDNVLVDLGIVLVGVVAAVLVLTVAAPADHGTPQPKRETGDGEDT
jgi:hypothetical protein